MADRPCPYERLVAGAMLCLNDHYNRALYSGAIAYKTNAHNLRANGKEYLGRQPIDFGTMLVTETFYIHPNRKMCVHGELHIKMSVDFGDVPFSMEEKIRGSEEDLVSWGRDFKDRLSKWFSAKEGFVTLIGRKLEVEEWHAVLGKTKAGF